MEKEATHPFVTSVALAEELYALSGWEAEDHDFVWFWWGDSREELALKRELMRFNGSVHPDTQMVPAYQLGELVRRLPDGVRVMLHHAFMRDGSRRTYEGTPENSAAKLCIELLKEGVIK